MSFQSRCSGRKVTQGLSSCTKEKPGWRIASVMSCAVPFWSPEKPRAMKFAPAASAITSGWKGLMPVPWG